MLPFKSRLEAERHISARDVMVIWKQLIRNAVQLRVQKHVLSLWYIRKLIFIKIELILENDLIHQENKILLWNHMFDHQARNKGL